MTISEAAAAEHLHDLRTTRRDVLDDYARTSGRTDWAYTEEALCHLTSADYLEAMKLVYESLRTTEGVSTPPPALS